MPPDSKKNIKQPSADSPTQLSISENFHQYFRIRFASSKELRHEAFRIRYQVYCEELGWEEKRPERLETDEFDDFAYHCLLEHTASKSFAGCVRVVIPPPHRPAMTTPFEAHCLPSVNPDIIDLSKFVRGGFGEISRLAVPASFRRRRDEDNHSFKLNSVDVNHVFSKEERRNFPNIAIGLYLASIALSKLCSHDATFVMMEPKLHRRLIRFGLPFEQAGDAIDYHGLRALFYLPAAGFCSNLNPELLQLFDDIFQQLQQQINLLPYTDPSDR